MGSLRIVTRSKKRTLSTTDFYDDAKEQSPNKKIKIVSTNKMDIDTQTDHALYSENKVSVVAFDVDGDVLMETNGCKLKLSPNRVRRSGLEFCVECGIGIKA